MVQDYFGEGVATLLTRGLRIVVDPNVLGPAVDLLAELAGNGAALEFAVGTGRVAPNMRRGALAEFPGKLHLSTRRRRRDVRTEVAVGASFSIRLSLSSVASGTVSRTKA